MRILVFPAEEMFDHVTETEMRYYDRPYWLWLDKPYPGELDRDPKAWEPSRSIVAQGESTR